MDNRELIDNMETQETPETQETQETQETPTTEKNNNVNDSTNNFILGNWNLLELYTNSGWKIYNNILIPKQLFYPLALTSTIQWFPFMNSWIILTIDKFIYGPKVALFYSNEL